MSCPATVHETVCVEAQVTINPDVTVEEEIQTFCVGEPSIGGCGEPLVSSCSFLVSQQICVQIPLTFTANASAVPTGIVCGTPAVGGCSVPTTCTFTVGYFKRHPDVTGALIEAAGGSIVLGIEELGLSYPVTTIEEAVQVLDLNTPSPPIPEENPHYVQYQQLYAQLLAANLNVINGATCTFATDAIAAANTFIATSPEEGLDDAPLFQEPLELFNAGSAEGCPEHCPE